MMKKQTVFAYLQSTMFVIFVLGVFYGPVIAAQTETVERARPAIELGAPFGDNAILQRQMPVPAWGWSKPGTEVTVEFAGQKKKAIAGNDGKWMLRLDALKANANPQEMVISDNNGNKLVLKNIVVGEVWMTSGQSNMQWPAGKCIVGRKLIPQINERVKAGEEKQPIIREGKVTNVFSSLYPIEHAQGAWGSNWGDFSAIAFAFAYDLYKELQIPIGIVNCAFSTTQIQAWVPREGFEGGTDEYTKAIYQKILESDHRGPEHKAAWDKYYPGLRDWAKDSAERTRKGLPVNKPPSVPGNMHGNRDACWMYNGKIHPMVPYAIRGAIWNQGYANQNEGMTYRNNLHSLVRGWRKVWAKPELPVYFHQFYCPGGYNDGITLNSTAEMRLGTSLAAKEIPNAGMASQIDITGGVHYYNKAVPGQRLARHALKNQYGKDIVADGPIFKSYKVEGSKLIVEFDHAEGGLVAGKSTAGADFADPQVIADGDDQVKLFYIADKDRLWHQAKVKIDGEKIVLTAPGLSKPCGVAYGCNGVGTLPSIYNRAMLPLTPFIYYDHKLVTRETWPDDPVKVAGADSAPAWKRRRVSVASQYRDNCVIQAGVPTPFWGAATEGDLITLKFAGIEKTCTLGPGEQDWRIEVPSLPASDEPKTLELTCERDGELYATWTVTGIVVGEVWYVAVPDFSFTAPMETQDGDVRLFTPNAAKRSNRMPYRYKLEIPPKGTRHYAIWRSGSEMSERSSIHVFANVLGARIRKKTGGPVGIVVMNTRDKDEIRISNWIGYEWLKQTPSLAEYYEDMRPRYHPDPQDYIDRVTRHIADWQTFWKTVPPAVLASKRFDDGAASMAIPSLPAAEDGESSATETFNMLITSFNPANFRGVICLTPASFFEEDRGASFGSDFSVLANCWKKSFACGDPHFFYTIPSKELAPKITMPDKIKGKNTAHQINHWLTDKTNNNRQLMTLIDQVVSEAYK